MTGTDPLTAPLTYPGLPPWRPAVLVTDAEVIALQPVREAPLGEWLLRRRGARATGADPHEAAAGGPDAGDPAASGAGARNVRLSQFLRNTGNASAWSPAPVLAVGSNASPAQVRRKMSNAGLPTRVPITAVRVQGLAVGVSAHVSRAGYLPATPVPDAGAMSDLWVVWLDADGLRVMDATEPNYQRVRLPPGYPVQLTAGQPVPRCWVYVSRRGCLVSAAGEPRRLTDQATLITALLAEIPALAALVGSTPQEWMERTRDARVRNTIRGLFEEAGLVRHPAGL